MAINRIDMAWSITELGADILLFEQLLDSSLCRHIIQIAECCQFKPAGSHINNLLPTSLQAEAAMDVPTRNESIVGYLNVGRYKVKTDYGTRSY